MIFVADVANSVGDDIANFAQKLGGQDETLLQPGKSPQKSNLSGKLIRRWSLSALFWSYGLESVQDFLIKLDIKQLMHPLEISIFSLKNDFDNQNFEILDKVVHNFVKPAELII